METLKQLTECYGPSGHEDKIRELISEIASKYADEVSTDTLGNLIVRKKGSGKKIMLAAHMDEIGIIVTFIDENGFIRFSPVGGLNKKELVFKRVQFENGIIGVISTEEENDKNLITKMYIDIGAKNKADAEAKVSIGDMAVFCGEYHETDNVVISKALDNRAGCYVLLEALKQTKSNNDLYFVFTVQEEVGLRGAKTAAFGIDADFAVAVDVTDTGDTPESPDMAVKLNGGAAVKIMDDSVLCDATVRSDLIDAAKKAKVSYQLEVLNCGGTDAGAISLTRNGIKTGGLSIPTRYIHSPSEMISISDLEACIKVIVEYIK